MALEDLKQRRQSFLQYKLWNEHLDATREAMNNSSIVQLEFNSNDQMIELDEDYKSEEEETPHAPDWEEDLKKPLKFYVGKNEKSRITVNFGNGSKLGQKEITMGLFNPLNDKTKNAAIFIENLQKTKQLHLNKMKKDEIVL